MTFDPLTFVQALQQNVRDQKALINTRFVYVCEHGTQLQKLFDAFSKAKDSNDIEQLFDLHKQIKVSRKPTYVCLYFNDCFKLDLINLTSCT
jgi:hypothetical protein